MKNTALKYKKVIIDNIAELSAYYVYKTNTYWIENSVKFNCDVDIKANIWADNIEGGNIFCDDIRATSDIKANKIIAKVIECDGIKAKAVTCNTLKDVIRAEISNLVIM